jgi:glycosyltransferase involved in cell wall biosynthesis
LNILRILYFSFVELDASIAPRTHTLGIIKGFAQHGCWVDALVPRPLKTVPSLTNVRFVYLWPWQFSRIGALWVKLLSGILMFWLCLTNKYDFIYVRELEINPGPRWCSRLFKVPLYIEINDLLVPYFSKIGARAGRIAEVARNQKLDLRQAAGLIVNSIPMRQWLLAHYDLNPGKLHFLINGAEPPEGPCLSKEEARRRLGMPLNSFCLGFLGNIFDRYDFNTLLEACRLCITRVPDLYLLFVGDGPLKDSLSRRVSEQGFGEKALFTGYVKPEALGGYLPAMDLGLCLRGHYFNRMYGSITTKCATYGIYKIPMIATATSLEDYPEAMQKSLFVVPPEDPVALAGLIERLHEKREEIRERAKIFHSFVMQEMTWEAVAAKILRIASKRVQGVQNQATVREPSLCRGDGEFQNERE